MIRLEGGSTTGDCSWIAGMHLPPPLLQYGDSVAPAPGRWEYDGAGAWSWSDGMMRIDVELHPSADDATWCGQFITLRATALRELTLWKCVVNLQMPCESQPFHIDPRLQWRALRGKSVSSELTPLVVGWRDVGGQPMELRSVGGSPTTLLTWKRGLLQLAVKLDSAALHPRWVFVGGRPFSTASPQRPEGWEVSANFVLRPVKSLEHLPPVAARYPSGAQAAFTITDHCDFDTVTAVRTFLEGDRDGGGWLGRGLRMTKGVFATVSPDGVEANVPTLRDPEYRALLQRLHAEGSEIAPHGVNERGNIEPEAFRDALEEISASFAPSTWIDHGCSLHYCYSMGGAENPDYLLKSELRRHGIHTLWAYQDVPMNPVGVLNMLMLPASDLGKVALQIGRHLLFGRPLVAARYGRSALLARTSGSMQHVIGRALTVARREYMRLSEGGAASRLAGAVSIPWAVVTDAVRSPSEGSMPPPDDAVPFTREDVLDLVPTLYPERAVPLSQLREDDFLLFTTMEVLHTDDAYTPAAIERLISECGMHVAHTYLSNRLPYVAGIYADSEGRELSAGWRETVQALEHAVFTRRLWNPTMGELAQWIRGSQPVELIPIHERVVAIHNPGAERLEGYTLLLPGEVNASEVSWGSGAPAGSRAWGRWLRVWGELPARKTIRVSW